MIAVIIGIVAVPIACLSLLGCMVIVKVLRFALEARLKGKNANR
jgi:hypothetical protein